MCCVPLLGQSQPHEENRVAEGIRIKEIGSFQKPEMFNYSLQNTSIKQDTKRRWERSDQECSLAEVPSFGSQDVGRDTPNSIELIVVFGTWLKTVREVNIQQVSIYSMPNKWQALF